MTTELDLLHDMHGDIKVVKSDVAELKVHVQRTNGMVADLAREQLIQQGAMKALQWIIARAVIPLLGIGVAVAGVVLTFVIWKGG